MRDLREAIRALRATPIVTAGAVLTLALGIGANTAIFSILNSLLLRPLPVRDPGGLVAIGGEVAGQDVELMHPAWLAIRDRGLLEGAFAWAKDGLSEVQGGETRPVSVIWASDAFFDTLGVRPALGTTLDPRQPAAVISDRFWSVRFGRAADVVGRTIVLDRIAFTIAGVSPPSFFGFEVGATFDAILPLDSEPLLGRVPSRLALWPWLHVAGRVPSDRTVASLDAALRAVQPLVRAETMPGYSSAEDRDAYLKEPWTLRTAGNGTSRLRGRYGAALKTLMAIAALVLLIGCANILNLQLARANARRYERSVRAALGAPGWRLMRPVLYESALLAVAGTALGVALAKPGARLLVAQLATWASVPALNLTLDTRVLGVSSALMIGTLLVFGVAPALLAARAAPMEALRRAPARGYAAGARPAEILIALQIGVCVLLLVGAGLFIRSFAALASRDLGFDRRPVVVAAVDTGRSAVPAARRAELFERLRSAAADVPGVRAAAVSTATPLGNAGNRFTPAVSLDGDVASDSAPRVLTNPVSPGWFDTYGTRLRAGRDFSSADAFGSAPVAIVNEAFARRFFAGQSPLGRTFSTTTPGIDEGSVTPEIVGIVEDAAFTNLRNPVEATVYRPLAQAANAGLLDMASTICVSARAAPGVPPEHLRGAVALALASVDASLVVSTITVKAQLDAGYVRERLLGILAGFFAALGLLLAAIGLYGVTSLTVHMRSRELAVRAALGAQRRSLMRLVIGRGAVVAAIGVTAGFVASVLAGRLVAALLYGVTPRDPLAFAAAAVTLFATVVAAAWLPARRAARSEPAIALRES